MVIQARVKTQGMRGHRSNVGWGPELALPLHPKARAQDPHLVHDDVRVGGQQRVARHGAQQDASGHEQQLRVTGARRIQPHVVPAQIYSLWADGLEFSYADVMYSKKTYLDHRS